MTESRTFVFILAMGAPLAALGLSGWGSGTAGPSGRMMIIVVLAVCGFILTQLPELTGLTVQIRSRRSIQVAMAIAAVVAAWIMAIDYAMDKPPPAVELSGLFRLAALSALSFNEEIVWRLFTMTAILWLLSPRRSPGGPMIWIAIVAAQCGDILLHLPLPTEAGQAVYNVARYLLPGVAWGWLYWRHGLIAAQIGHVSCHWVMAAFL